MTDTANSFLGTGWAFPPTFHRQGADLAMVSGVDDIAQSLEILLGTRLRERLWHDDFGCDLSSYLFESIDQSLINRIRNSVADALLYHEPRIQVEQVEVQDGGSAGLLNIEVVFKVRSTNSRYNMVYPFYLEEAAGRKI
ncbi:MAG: GPW/gp25 family protein [Saprospiraceae bacterium]|nr:GPW/gp25 family protein [Saprospiraceae bacterium]